MQALVKGAAIGSILGGLLLAGCGRAAIPNSNAGVGSIATTSSTATTSPMAALSCSLPVAQAISGPTPPKTGFVALPSGTFQADATGAMVTEPGSTRTKTIQTPVLYGDGGATYDRAFKRWLPVAQAQVSADGSAYVYTREASPTQLRNEIHLVTVSTATDQVIYDQGAYHALSYQPEGIYLTHHLSGADGSNGLWLLDPATRAVKSYPASVHASWISIAGGSAWTYSTDGNRFGSTTFARLDLSSGAETTWFTATSSVQIPQSESGSKSVRAIGFDANAHPIVEVYTMGGNVTPEIWLLSAPSQATQVSGLHLAQFTPPPGITDSHGAWVVGSDGIYLYKSESFERVASAPPGWSTPDYSVAGSCA